MKRIIPLLIALALLACKKNIVPKPDHFLNDKEMEQLMYDLALLEAFKNAEPRLLDSLQITALIALKWLRIWSITHPYLKSMTLSSRR